KSNYMYPSDPNDTSVGSWSEVSDHNPFGDRRGVGSAGPITLLPHSRISFDIAYVFGIANPTGNYLNCIVDMNNRIKTIEYDFQHDSTPCNEIFTNGVNEINPPNLQVSIFPNPANDKINIVYNAGTGTVNYNILNVLGQSISHGAFGNSSNNQLDVSKLPAGIYFLKLIRNNNVVVGKFVKE
ncbi:MAG TPA: T9SS type A sorting domain-containing protein, partial [Bacteroidia bacterium]|nr:T9SS type A sorting domain-containing protein [Bacteroidia bacterium]